MIQDTPVTQKQTTPSGDSQDDKENMTTWPQVMEILGSFVSGYRKNSERREEWRGHPGSQIREQTVRAYRSSPALHQR